MPLKNLLLCPKHCVMSYDKATARYQNRCTHFSVNVRYSAYKTTELYSTTPVSISYLIIDLSLTKTVLFPAKM